MLVEVIVPSEYQGQIIAQLSKRSGVVLSMEAVDNYAIISAEVST